MRGAFPITTSSGITAEIKSKLPVLDVVGETVELKRAGTVHKGLCPFHAEKTPSFIVSPDRETWHCFGCGEHGDIFTFLMRRDGLDFREALGRLAEKAGVELSERTAREDRRKRRLREALEAAIAWYREVLLQAHQSERARAYLAERGFSEETLDRFAIGYAPNNWEAMTKRLRAKGFTDAELTDAGLASPSNRGGVYDRFRGRIIIPIRDVSGRAIGLGGRIMPDGEGPKYLNSPATILFDKSRTLYGIDLARGAIRREKLAVIVEGYTDVMAAHQAGFANVVASLGTALTQGQVELANRYAEGVALAYDVDLAGEAATQRGLLEELGPVVSKVRVIRIPAGKDPDELIRTDPDGWRRAVADAQELLPYFIDSAWRDVDPRHAGDRSSYATRMLDLIRRIPNRVERDPLVTQVAMKSGIDERVLRDELSRGPRAVPIRPINRSTPAQAISHLTTLEQQALAMLLLNPGVAGDVSPEEIGHFRDGAARALAESWIALMPTSIGDQSVQSIVAKLAPESRELVTSLLAFRADVEDRSTLITGRDGVHYAFVRLEIERIDERLHDLEGLLRMAQEDGTSTEVARLQEVIRAEHARRSELANVKKPQGEAWVRA
ncbi:MAG: DNA primase [Candidatus Limnocylindria bacterium]